MLHGFEGDPGRPLPEKICERLLLTTSKRPAATLLFRFEQGLSALNARRQRAARVNAPDIACRFIVSDMLDIDQSQTSATIRADASAVSLKREADPPRRRSDL
jgi:hypothetical protein